jgi:hypothetical protein
MLKMMAIAVISIMKRRMLKMISIMIPLVQFIASEIEKEGLDLNNEENVDSYLNTKFM